MEWDVCDGKLQCAVLNLGTLHIPFKKALATGSIASEEYDSDTGIYFRFFQYMILSHAPIFLLIFLIAETVEYLGQLRLYYGPHTFHLPLIDRIF